MRHHARAIIAAASLLAAPGLHAQALQCVTPEGKTIVTDGDCPDGTRVTKFYRLLEPEAPHLTPHEQNQRALRTWEGMRPEPETRPQRRAERAGPQEPHPDQGVCLALKQRKEAIQSWLKHGLHGHAALEHGREQLRQIRDDQCRSKCIRC